MNKGCFFALCCLLSMGAAIKAEIAVANQLPAGSKEAVAPKIEEITNRQKKKKVSRKLKKSITSLLMRKKLLRILV